MVGFPGFMDSQKIALIVADPWNFGADPYPDPRIHTSDEWIRILLFSSVTFKTSTKN